MWKYADLYWLCRRELGLPDKLGEEGSMSLLSANIVDGSVIEISE